MKKLLALISVVVIVLTSGCYSASNVRADKLREFLNGSMQKENSEPATKSESVALEKEQPDTEEEEQEEQAEQETAEPTEQPDVDTVKVGEYITFGNYEQDNILTNGKEAIEWLVLDKKDGYALVISRYALDCQPYNSASYIGITWQTCSLRVWLNGVFLNNAFTADEISKISKTPIATDKNSHRPLSDSVFLLNSLELSYLDSLGAMACRPTPYAVANNAWTNDTNGNCWWWLLSPDDGVNTAAYVNSEGATFFESYQTYDSDSAVRPAMWVYVGD